MQVYKAYFKIIRSHLLSLLIYFFIFVIMAVIITKALGQTTPTAFTETRSKVAFFNEEDTPLVEGLKGYLNKNAEIVPLQDDLQSIQDALFFGKIEYVLRIPKGFTDDFLSGKNDLKIQKTAASGSTSSIYMDFLLNKYLNMAGLYIKNLPGITGSQLTAYLNNDLNVQAAVSVNTYNRPEDLNYLSYYFQYLAYAILAILIMGVTSFMMAFNESDLNNRNLCSPITPLNMNMQIVLANATFALVVWAVLCALTFLLYGKVQLNIGTVLLSLNALAFTLASLSIGFLAGKFIRSHGVQGAVTNVISLGIAFLSGIFVEQELLGKTVLTIAGFTPGYWYIKAVNDLRNMVIFNPHNIIPVIYSILIQLAFAAAFIIIALFVTKQRRMSKA